MDKIKTAESQSLKSIPPNLKNIDSVVEENEHADIDRRTRRTHDAFYEAKCRKTHYVSERIILKYVACFVYLTFVFQLSNQ